jgi:HPt (histidine-containing phosphotransfer) domain-containing protein
MASKHPIELFMPPNMLKAKVGGTVGGLDAAALMRAEKAMDTLKSEFGDWFTSDVDRLTACRDAFAANKDGKARTDLLRACHDIKGQAATFEFPLVARIASSLCRMIEALPSAQAVPLLLVDAHVTAIRIIFRDNIKDTANRMATELIAELEARVRETIEAAAA